jgi:hypothetical protein
MKGARTMGLSRECSANAECDARILHDDALSAVSGGYSWNQFVGDVKGVGESFVQGLHDGAQEIKKIFS